MIENEAIAVALISAVFTLIGIFIKGIIDFFKGRHAEERKIEEDRRDAVTRYKDEAREAQDRATKEWEKARRYSIYAHEIQLFCIREHNTDPHDFPTWPGEDS